MNILGWSNYRILSVEEREHDYQITAEQSAASLRCPQCSATKLYRHEIKEQLYMDIPIRGKRTAHIIVRKRYRCEVFDAFVSFDYRRLWRRYFQLLYLSLHRWIYRVSERANYYVSSKVNNLNTSLEC